MVPTPTVVAESIDWGFGHRLQIPTKVLTRSGQFNVQHDVQVQIYSFAFLYSLPLDMDRGGASRASRSREWFISCRRRPSDAPMVALLGLASIPNPPPGVGMQTATGTLLQQQDHSKSHRRKCHAHMTLLLSRLVHSLELSTCWCSVRVLLVSTYAAGQMCSRSPQTTLCITHGSG